LRGRAIVHGHCHQKAIMGMGSEAEVLERAGLEFKMLDDGCCGMAGSFGFEPGDKHDVSIKCGERALLPDVRRAAAEEFVIADGFSCKTQIEQGTKRRALHLAQVLQLALRNGGNNSRGEPPEAQFERERSAEFRRANLKTAALVGTVLLTGVLTWRFWSRTAQTNNRD
jgi:hypothetical protein